jgi:octaprenyl-diphosphate synthase
MSVVDTYKSLDSFVRLEKAFKEELNKVESYLTDTIKDQPQWFQEVVNHLVQAGGKRIRPLLVCLSYSLVSDKKMTGDAVIMAALSEYVHSATLFHDDVIDEGEERRGKPTVNKVYGNHTAVLGGDFILGKVFQELNKLNKPQALSLMIDTVAKLVQGEIHQMDMKKKFSATFDDYERLIYLKTASLFEWSTTAGGIAAGQDDLKLVLLKSMGNHIGRIFQIVDDILDYTGSNILGKKRLQDFYQGKITLPLLFLFKMENTYFGQWKEAVNSNDKKGLEALSKTFMNRIKKPDIQSEMRFYLQKDVNGIRNIIEQLPESPYQEYVNDLINFLVSRMA